jgi:hypothetical protein
MINKSLLAVIILANLFCVLPHILFIFIRKNYTKIYSLNYIKSIKSDFGLEAANTAEEKTLIVFIKTILQLKQTSYTQPYYGNY